MDVQKNEEDIESYLQALRTLYSLLVVTDPQQCLQNHTSREEILDQKARSLLKDLLDDAAKKVLKVTSEVMASNLGLSNTHNFTQHLQSQDSMKPTLLLTNAQSTSLDVVNYCDNDLQKAADLTINHRVPDDETATSVASEQSGMSTSLAEFRNRKKRCRICQRSSPKQLKSTEKRKSSSEVTQDVNKEITGPYSKPWRQVDKKEKVQAFNINAIKADSSYDGEMEERISEFQFNPSRNVSPTCLLNNDATGIVKAGGLQNFATGSGKKKVDTDFISKDASDAIKIIESHISALKVGGKQMRPLWKQIADHQGPFMFGANSVSGTGSISPIMQKKAGLLSQGDRTQVGYFVVGRNDPHSSKQIQIRTKTSTTGKGLSHPTTMRQTVRGKRSDHFRVSPIYPYQMKEEMGGVKKKVNHKGYQRMGLSDQQESSGTTSGPVTSSSSWTTEQGNTSYYDSEEHSVSDQSQSKQDSSTNTNSESKEGYYISDSIRGHHSSGTSYSDDEMYSLPSCTPSQSYSSSSSGNAEYFPSDHSSNLGFSDHSQDHYSRTYSSTDRKRPTKEIRRLKKLKDKLAIIFHHHHHHHHHHYNDDIGHHDQQFHGKNDTSSPKRAAKMFGRKSRGEAYREQDAEKFTKSMVHNVPNKKQGANLHKLVNGFVRHIRQSNKPKKSKGNIDHKPKEHQYASKKPVKKVHWWQLLRRRRIMKMPKRQKVKLGHSSDKKSKFQTVPTLKWR